MILVLDNSHSTAVFNIGRFPNAGKLFIINNNNNNNNKKKLAYVRESTNIEDGCAVAVVENQDHVDAIESDRLPCRFGNKLLSL